MQSLSSKNNAQTELGHFDKLNTNEEPKIIQSDMQEAQDLYNYQMMKIQSSKVPTSPEDMQKTDEISNVQSQNVTQTLNNSSLRDLNSGKVPRVNPAH